MIIHTAIRVAAWTFFLLTLLVFARPLGFPCELFGCFLSYISEWFYIIFLSLEEFTLSFFMSFNSGTSIIFLVLSLFLLFFLVGLFLVSFYSNFWKIFFACILGLVVCRGKRCLSTSTGTDRGPPCMLDNLVYLMETVHHLHSWCFLFLHYHSYI